MIGKRNEFPSKMSSSHMLVTLICALLPLPAILATSLSSCASGDFSIIANARNAQVKHCKKLDAHGAEIGWDYISSTPNKTVHILFGARLPALTGWIAWGLNPLKPRMVGTRALIAFQHTHGSIVQVLPYNVTVATKLRLCPFTSSKIDFDFEIREANYNANTSFITMFVALSLPPPFDVSKLNHVWQVGSYMAGSEPRMHATTIPNFDCQGTIDVTSPSGESSHSLHQRLRKVHGILSMIGWGIILPSGVVSARYLKDFPFEIERSCPIHVPCQICGFMVGSFAWALGMWLGNQSKNYVLKTHRIIGITIFSMASLQVVALWLRPKKEDDLLKYWRIYHHFLGYSLIVLIIFNIFKGIHILSPSEEWKWGYRGVLALFALIVLVLETISWCRSIAKYSCSKNNAK